MLIYSSFFNLNSLIILTLLISILLGTLISVAYYTLFERKVLAAMQRRRGPNVVGIYGLLQPLADGLKLMAKEGIKPWLSVNYIFTLSPILSLIMSFLGWIALPSSNINLININSNIDIIIFFCISSLGSYGVIFAGWSSFSRYAVMGSIRGIAQLISYEVVLLLTIMPIAVLVGSFNFNEINLIQSQSCWFILPFLPLSLIFFIILLAETNRTPFDLPEAEAELVSGFNVEYSSILFAMFSLAEYNSMLIMSTFFVILFLGGWGEGYIFFLIKTILIAFLIVQTRAALPRYRYDQLMSICWYIFLPLTIFLFILYVSIFLIFDLKPLVFYDVCWEIQNHYSYYIDNVIFNCK